MPDNTDEQQTILASILNLQGTSSNVVRDDDVAKYTGISVDSVRRTFEDLSAEDSIRLIKTASGSNAYLSAVQRLRIRWNRGDYRSDAVESAFLRNVSYPQITGWNVLKSLGSGGQGKVYLVRDERNNTEKELYQLAINAIPPMLNLQHGNHVPNLAAFADFRLLVNEIVTAENVIKLGALKVLHEPREARNSNSAANRLELEIRSLNSIAHPALLRIIDSDTEHTWFVSEYHPGGMLADSLASFAGNVAQSLKAIRPIVEGVAKLHALNIVHRDIKPQNIFIGQNGLILGDFGLVHFADVEHTRISETFENVGSRDWMPGWAHGMRIDDVKPSFDVFALGKVIWAMISGRQILQLWYYDKDVFNVEKLYAEAPGIQLVNPLLSKCIVEEEGDCLPDAGALLVEIDKTLAIIDGKSGLFSEDVDRPCRVCAAGNYRFMNPDPADVVNWGIQPAGNRSLKIFACEHCGHVQMFASGGGIKPSAWPKEETPRKYSSQS